MSGEPPIIAQARGDVSTSNTSSNSLRHIHAQADGDQNPSSSSSTDFGMRVGVVATPQTGQQPENRSADDDVNRPFKDLNGPVAENPQYLRSISRSLSDSHIHQIASQATKELNNDLIVAMRLTTEQQSTLKDTKDRYGTCSKLLRLWCGNGIKTVLDIKELLEKAGGDKYKCFIDDIVNSPF